MSPLKVYVTLPVIKGGGTLYPHYLLEQHLGAVVSAAGPGDVGCGEQGLVMLLQSLC